MIAFVGILIGIAHCYLRQARYQVVAQVVLKKSNLTYARNLFSYGDVDFLKYKQRGSIVRSSDRLRFTTSEKELLHNLRNEIGFQWDDPSHCINIYGETADTNNLIPKINNLAEILRKKMVLLCQMYNKRELDSLYQKESSLRAELQDSILAKIQLQNTYQALKGSERMMLNQYVEYEYTYMAMQTFSQITELRKLGDFLNEITIVLHAPHTSVIQHKISNRSLLIRWTGLGFIGGCLLVLAGSFIPMRSQKHRD